jgi:hypothetical protein
MSIMGFLGEAGLEGALFAIKRAMEAEPYWVTIPTIVADNLLDFRK